MAALCSQWIACSPARNGGVAGRSTRSLGISQGHDMWSVSAEEKIKAGPWLVGASTVLFVASFCLVRYSYSLCHAGYPITVPVVALPVAGAISAIVALFFRPNSGRATILKLLLGAANTYQFFVGLLALTGMGLIECG
jgi:hypothetical protein